MKEKIHQFMSETFLIEFGDDVTESTDLFQCGLIDSYGYIQLIKFLEETFGFEVTEEEMLSNVLTSIDSIVHFVEIRTCAGAAA